LPGQTRSGPVSQKKDRKRINKDKGDLERSLNRHRIKTSNKMNEIHFCLSAIPHRVNKKIQVMLGMFRKNPGGSAYPVSNYENANIESSRQAHSDFLRPFQHVCLLEDVVFLSGSGSYDGSPEIVVQKRKQFLKIVKVSFKGVRVRISLGEG